MCLCGRWEGVGTLHNPEDSMCDRVVVWHWDIIMEIGHYARIPSMRWIDRQAADKVEG